MSVHTGQVTIATTNVAQKLSTTRNPAFQITVQNNAAHSVRVGDSTLVSTSGYVLPNGQTPLASVTLGPFTELSVDTTTTFVLGTSGDVVDFFFVK